MWNIYNFCYWAGQRLCESNELHYGGKGTYVMQNYIYASLAGVLSIRKEEKVLWCVRGHEWLGIKTFCKFYFKINIVEVQRGNTQNRVPLPGAVVTVKV